MTKFLDDQWCADRDIIEMKDINTWWADEKVSSLDISAPLSILPSVTVEQAIDIMVKEGFDQLPVITESGKIVGVATMGSLKTKLLKVGIFHLILLSFIMLHHSLIMRMSKMYVFKRFRQYFEISAYLNILKDL